MKHGVWRACKFQGVVTLLAAISYNGSKPRLSDLALGDIPTHADDLLVDKLSPVSQIPQTSTNMPALDSYSDQEEITLPGPNYRHDD